MASCPIASNDLCAAERMVVSDYMPKEEQNRPTRQAGVLRIFLCTIKTKILIFVFMDKYFAEGAALLLLKQHVKNYIYINETKNLKFIH